jgi:CBS-domain-containing membrane protein
MFGVQVLTFKSSTSAIEAMKQLKRHQILGAPLVDDENHMVGFIDVFGWYPEV